LNNTSNYKKYFTKSTKSVLRTCTPNEWNESEILQQAFDQHIKSRKIGTKLLLDWRNLFIDWLHQESTIIQFPKALQNIYPIDHKIQDNELRAWKAMFIACGCTNVTPFKKEKSDIASDPSADKETLLNLYNAGLINLGNSPIIIDKSMDFWESFKRALNNNKCGLDGKTRILSIIAEKFHYDDLQEKLQVITFMLKIIIVNHLLTLNQYVGGLNQHQFST